MFLEVSGFQPEVFISKEEITFLKQRIEKNYEINHEEITKLQINFYLILYFLSIKRESQGFYWDNSNYFSGKNFLFNEFDTQFFRDKYHDMEFQDIHRIEQSILTLRHKLNTYTDIHLDKTIPAFLETIMDKFKVNGGSAVYQTLLTYLKDLYISKVYADIPFHLINNRFTYFSKEVELTNPSTFSCLKGMVAQLEKDTHVSFYKDFDFLLYVIVTYLPEIMTLKINKNILLISNQSQEHACFLLSMVKKNLNIDPYYFENTKCIFNKKIEEIDLSDYQLILSTITIPEIAHKSMLINDFPSDKDFKHIKNYILS